MKNLTISVILGILGFSEVAMSTENYKPTEFWKDKEVVKCTLEKALDTAQIKAEGIRFDCAFGQDHFLAVNMANYIYTFVTNFTEQECLPTISMEEFLSSLDLRETEGEVIQVRKVWNFLDHVGSILNRKLY